MTFRQLEAFALVIRLGTIVAASQKLSLSQSAVSRLIADLERNLGFDLFVRVGRGLEPTSRGLAFYREVERSFSGVEVLNRVAAEIREGCENRIRIACLPTLSTTVIPLALARFGERFPDVVVEIDTATVGETLLALEERRTELAVTFALSPMDGVRIERLAEAEYVFAAKAGHELLRHPLVTSEMIAGEYMMGLMSSGPTLHGETDEARDLIERPAHRRIWCHTSATRYACVAAGLSASLAEPFSAPLYGPMGVEIRRFEPRLPLHYCFAVPSEAQRSKISVALRRSIRTAIADYASQHDLPIRTV